MCRVLRTEWVLADDIRAFSITAISDLFCVSIEGNLMLEDTQYSSPPSPLAPSLVGNSWVGRDGVCYQVGAITTPTPLQSLSLPHGSKRTTSTKQALPFISTLRSLGYDLVERKIKTL